VQIGEFSFIIATLGNQLHVIDEAIYPIIVAASVLTTFLTPYIMKTSVPCYNFLYNHAPKSMRARIDKREEKVAQSEQKVANTTSDKRMENHHQTMNKALKHTIITKHMVNLFIKNMTENDKKE
jgi:CPA2 family monovalent cation:H+ antiporter-2